MYQIKRIVLLVTLVCGLSACSKHQQISNDIDAYTERLSAFTGISVSKPQINASLMAPKKSELQKPVEQVSINLREFYAFKQCALNQLIAERNTALGKMQQPSSRYIYERELINELAACRRVLEASEQNEDEKSQLIAKLSEWQELKERALPAVWANFISQSDEIYSSMTQAQDFIAAAPSDNFQATRQAWQFLATSFESQTLNSTALENHLKELENARLLARMWRTQSYISAQLDAVSPLLEEYLTQNQCSDRKQEDDIKIMTNIFSIFFADKIQALAAELNKYHYQLSPLLEQLVSTSFLPKALSDYIQLQIGTNHEQYKQSMQRHIKLWQEIFARCA